MGIFDWFFGGSSNDEVSDEEDLTSMILEGVCDDVDVGNLSPEQANALTDLGIMAYGEDWLWS